MVLAVRRAEELNRMANELTRLGQKALAVPTDVGSRQSIDHLVAQTVETYGRVDGVVNVAGIGGAGLIAQASDDVLEQMVMINLLAPARLIQAALPFMKHDGSAAIVNIGSIAGEMGTNGMYSATKFGLRGLSDSLRRELWTKHIAVSLIEPGYIRTALTARTRTRRSGRGQGLSTSAAFVGRPCLLASHAAWCPSLSGHRGQTARQCAGTGTHPYLGMKGRDYAHTQ